MAKPIFVIFGGGPTALACALWCAREGPVKIFLPCKPNVELVPQRIEIVPINVVGGLVELGIHPHTIGVFNVIEQRLIAWNAAEPTSEVTKAAAHLERPSLENELLKLATRQTRVELCVSDSASARAAALEYAQRGACVIDATGRRASLASRRFRPRRPWVARMFHVSSESTMPLAPFMAAALPFGYVFRATGHRFCTIGIVGYGSSIAGSSVDICERLKKSEAAWIIEDIAARPWTMAGAKPASIQWADGDDVTSIGDAALARDALSSQGLASGLMDARYAAAIRTFEDRRAIADRSDLARIAHGESLARMIATCRWRGEPVWREYMDFLAGPARMPNAQAIRCPK